MAKSKIKGKSWNRMGRVYCPKKGASTYGNGIKSSPDLFRCTGCGENHSLSPIKA